MKKEKPWLKVVMLIMLFLFLLSWVASYDNAVSRGIGKVIDKPIEWVNEKATGAMVALAGVAVVFIAVSILVAAPVMAAVAFIIGAAAIVYGIARIAGWSGWFGRKSTNNPENVKLDPKG